jgi:hypothetical protein
LNFNIRKSCPIWYLALIYAARPEIAATEAAVAAAVIFPNLFPRSLRLGVSLLVDVEAVKVAKKYNAKQ